MSLLQKHHIRISGSGSQPILFAHGFGCDQNMWRFVAPAFEEKYKVVLFDYIGAGKSDETAYNRSKYSSLQGYADDVLAICHELDLKEVIFVGHSVSSMIGMLAAIKEPTLFQNLVFVGPSPSYINDGDYVGGFSKEDIEGLLESLESNYLGWSSAMAPVIMGRPDQPEFGEELTNSFCRTNPEIAKQFAEVTFHSDNRADLAKLTTPALILQCTNDVIAPIEVGKYLNEKISYSELKVLEANGHCPHLSAPEETIAAIKEYLEKTADMSEEDQEDFLELASRTEESAEDLYEHAPCGYISFLPNGTIIRINETLINWLGYAKEELLRRKQFQELLAIGSRIYYETHVGPLLQMQGFVNELNLDLLNKERQQLPMLANVIQVKDDSGKILVFRATLFNITDRKKYERELVLARKKAEEAAKIKAEFLSTVSHEIRTPLNAIIGISNLLTDTRPNPKQKELIDILKFSAGNLLHLINDILDFSKIEAGKVTLQEKDLNLQELLYSTLYSLGVKAEEKELQLEAFVDEKVPEYLVGDPIKITQILTNLIGNAIKFTHTGSVIVRLKFIKQTSEAVEIEFSVEDTGIGIAPDRLSRIFEEFTQASYDVNVEYGGTGLGLTISRKLLQLYNSELHVKSEPGQGSRFWFSLSLKLGKPPIAESVSLKGRSSEISQSLAGVKLLLAEDNEVNVYVLAQFLKKWGVEFDVAVNGEKALEMVQQSDYHLILMDLQMPVMDGYEASRRIRLLSENKYQDLPIIALSASAKFDLEERLENARMTDYIGKPFEPEKLFNLILHYSRLSPQTDFQSDSPAITQDQESGNAVMNFDRYQELTEGDPEARKELIDLTVRNLETSREVFSSSIKEFKSLQFQEWAHKLDPTLKILKAEPLLSALNQARFYLSEPKPDPVKAESITESLITQLDLLITALQEALPV